MKFVKYIFLGKVQGVNFRMSLTHQAKQLGLTGYVKNKSDGSVEAVALANDNIGKLLEFLQTQFNIDKIIQVEVGPTDLPANDFIIKY